MDVPIYQSEKVVIIRIEGREAYPIHRWPVRSFAPIPRQGYMGNSGWVEVAAAREPSAVCVAPPGSELFEHDGKTFLRCMIPRLDRARPTVLDADWLLSWSNSGAYGFRRRDSAVRAEPRADAAEAVRGPHLDAAAPLEAVPRDLGAAAGGGIEPGAGAAQAGVAEVGGDVGAGPAAGWLF